ncbi:DUF3667 domain-containing protein [Flagellimonas meishanensis]|uniref:DUF3667 domain-containing protein n=1 Tax=Flagellimonas meishanensis TaxID=2873264 RepID=UPI00223BEE56|nr:DUF3667 domain-containing protein [[Muricauda] meishanensis]
MISKGRYELKFRGTECLNCGHILDMSDKYCPNCSQANSTKKLTLKVFFDEFLSSLINYDSKLLKTLYALLLRPGRITKDYIEGKRISYTNPFRFLLSLAFLYFLMVTYNNQFDNLDRLAKEYDQKTGNDRIRVDLWNNKILADSAKIKQGTDKVLAKLDSAHVNTAEINEGIHELDSLGLLNFGSDDPNKDSIMLAEPKSYYESIKDEKGFAGLGNKIEFFTNMIRHDNLEDFGQANTKYGVPDNQNDKMAFNLASSIVKVVREPGSFINSTISKLPFVIFFFLPVFAVFIWLVYIRKKYTYTDHLIFSFHNQSLLFILLILSLIIDTIFDKSSAGIFLIIFGIYLYKAMRKFYGQGRFKTILKYLFLNTMFSVLALFAVIALFTGSIFTY